MSASKAKQTDLFDPSPGDPADWAQLPDDYSEEFIIATLLGPIKYEDRFVGWPPHITVVPWFWVESADQAIATLQAVAVITKQFTAEVAAIDFFGPRQNLPVLRVSSPKLHELHQLLVGGLENVDADFVAPHYMGPRYTPHITVKLRMKISAGSTVLVDKLWLIKAKAHEDRRTRLKQVVAEVELSA